MNLKMDLFIQDKLKKLYKMEMKFWSIMDMENKSGQMVQNMKVIGEMAKLKDAEFFTMKIEIYTPGNL